MKLTVSAKVDITQEVIALGLFEDEKETKFDKDLDKEILDAGKHKLFVGKAGEIYATKINGKFICVIGLGKKEELTVERIRKALGKVVNHTKKQQRTTISTNLPALAEKLNPELLGRATAEAL